MLHHAQVRAASPSTPANQKRPMDTNMTNGSASTIAASSLAPTPLSAEPTVNPPRRQSGLAIENIGETPSRPPPTSTHVKGATVGLSSMSEVTNSERLGVAAATSTTPSASPGKALHAESVHERLASEGAPVSRAQPVQQREISELSTEPSITAPFTPVNVMVARVRVGNS